MTECKNCKNKVLDESLICEICNYPIGGSESEQAKFIAKQVIQKSDVNESIERLKKARLLLFVLGAFYVIGFLIPVINKGSTISIVISMIIGLIFIGFGLWTFKRPKPALLIPLIITILYYIILLLVEPSYLWRGVLWKIIVLSGLFYGYFSVRKSDKILKENKYLASLLGFNKIGNK